MSTHDEQEPTEGGVVSASTDTVPGPWWEAELASVQADRDEWKARCIDGAQDAARRLEQARLDAGRVAVQARLDAGRVAADRDEKAVELQRLRNAVGDVRGMQSDGASAEEMDAALAAALSGTAPETTWWDSAVVLRELREALAEASRHEGTDVVASFWDRMSDGAELPSGTAPAPKGETTATTFHRAVCAECGNHGDGDGEEFWTTPAEAVGFAVGSLGFTRDDAGRLLCENCSCAAGSAPKGGDE